MKMTAAIATEPQKFGYHPAPYGGMETCTPHKRWQILCRFIPRSDDAQELAAKALFLAQECGLTPDSVSAEFYGEEMAGGPTAGAYIVQFNPRGDDHKPRHETFVRVELARWGGARG